MNDFADRATLVTRERELADMIRPAGSMYEGEQHRAVMRAVQQLRGVLTPDAVAVKIVSAGYGVVDERDAIAPYNVTFSTMSKRDAVVWARARAIPSAVREVLTNHDLAFVLLGSRYLDAIAPPLQPDTSQRLVYLAKPSELARLAAPGVVVVPAGRDQCSAYGAGTIALKGRMFERIVSAVANEGSSLLERIHSDATSGTLLNALGEGSKR